MHTKLQFEHPINASLQIGDEIYFSTPSIDGITATKPVYAGNVYAVFRDSGYIVVDKDPNQEPILSYYSYANAFPLVLFAKNISANESSLKGYYADVTFENTSNTKCELFGFGSETSFSSK